MKRQRNNELPLAWQKSVLILAVIKPLRQQIFLSMGDERPKLKPSRPLLQRKKEPRIFKIIKAVALIAGLIVFLAAFLLAVYYRLK